MATKKKYNSSPSFRRAKVPITEDEQLRRMNILLNDKRIKTAKDRLKISDFLDKKWLSHRGNYDYYIFDINRTLITRRGFNFLAIKLGNMWKKNKEQEALLYMNELYLYAHMCFRDYATFPSGVLKDMVSNLNTIKKSINLIKSKIDKYQIEESPKLTIGTKYAIGLGSGLPHNYSNNLWEEMDTIEYEVIELMQIIEADRKHKMSKSKTNFLGKIQYFIYLCKELFKMIDFEKYPDVNTDNYDGYLKGFILKISSEIPEISRTDHEKIIDSMYLRPEDKKKYEVNDFVNLMGCESPIEYKKLRKLINF